MYKNLEKKCNGGMQLTYATYRNITIFNSLWDNEGTCWVFLILSNSEELYATYLIFFFLTCLNRNRDLTEIKERFPNLRFIVIKETGHWVHAEKPNLFMQHVLEFLNKTTN